MTATEELRRMLDERGVEYYEHEAPAADCVAFFDGNGWHDCWDSVDGEVNVTFSITPEQAIAATLGSCNCSNSERTGTCHNAAPSYLDFLCSKCGFVHYHSDTNDTGDGNEWRFCPNCGRRVEVDA